MKRDICIYATIKGAETIKTTQSRLLGVKIAHFCTSVPKLYSYVRKCWPKYLEHMLHADKLATAKAQNSSRAVGSNCTKTYFYVYIEQCSNVQTPKTEKTCEKVRTQHRTRPCQSRLYE